MPAWEVQLFNLHQFTISKCRVLFCHVMLDHRGWFHLPRMHKCHIKPAHFASSIVASATHGPNIGKFWQVPDPTIPEDLQNFPKLTYHVDTIFEQETDPMRSQAYLIDLKSANRLMLWPKSVLQAVQLLSCWHRATGPHLAVEQDNLGFETESHKILLTS